LVDRVTVLGGHRLPQVADLTFAHARLHLACGITEFFALIGIGTAGSAELARVDLLSTRHRFLPLVGAWSCSSCVYAVGWTHGSDARCHHKRTEKHTQLTRALSRKPGAPDTNGPFAPIRPSRPGRFAPHCRSATSRHRRDDPRQPVRRPLRRGLRLRLDQ